VRDAPRDIVRGTQPRLQISVRIGTPGARHQSDDVGFRCAFAVYYTFLDSTLIARGQSSNCSKQHGLPAIALTDIGNLHGAVEFAQRLNVRASNRSFGTELR